jgi:hypothetical protein
MTTSPDCEVQLPPDEHLDQLSLGCVSGVWVPAFWALAKASMEKSAKAYIAAKGVKVMVVLSFDDQDWGGSKK